MPHLAAPASPPPAPYLMSDAREAASSSPPSERGRRKAVVVVMGATGAGKSRLAVDLAGHFAGVEVVSADSMQVYRGLDVLTNKVSLDEQNGVPHHLLSIVDPSVEFTCRHFRDHALPIIEDILDRGGLPVVVGGTNFYIQALVSPFLFEDMSEDMQGCTLSDQLDDIGLATDGVGSGYEHLKEIDPIAAQRIHPNNHRKVHYQAIFSKEKLQKTSGAGLLAPGAVYTQGLRQAIGVREFDEFFRLYFTKKEPDEIKAGMLNLHDDKLKSLLDEAVSQLKANTRRLVRRQRRRLHRLNKDFGWNLHHTDATEAFQCTTGDSWHVKVIKPCADTVRKFLSNDTTLASKDCSNDGGGTRLASRELWTQYVCEACDNRVLRGAHEWEQHKQGRGHRKRTQRLKRKSKIKSTSSEAEV
ncbi:hypothetical protein ACQJBY_009635 [Aegilops geniculata]